MRYESGRSAYIADEFVEKLNKALDMDIPYFKDPYDLTGQKFGKLVVVEYIGTKGKCHRYWKCRCDCGKEIEARGSHLLYGNTKSCGCYCAEITRERSSTQNGLSRSKIYYIWRGMLKRCYLETNDSYQRYGGRGIKVCDEWKSDFQSFYKWAISAGYSETENMSLDRVNVNGNYEPSNCRWADAKTQANNRSNTVFLTLNGETHSVSEWSDITGISRVTIKNRLHHGVPVEKALTIRNMRRE